MISSQSPLIFILTFCAKFSYMLMQHWGGILCIGAPSMLVLTKWVTFQYLVITSFRTDLILVSGWRTTGAEGDAHYWWQLLIQTHCQCRPCQQLRLQEWLPHILRASQPIPIWGQGLSKRAISWCRDRAWMQGRWCNGWSIMGGPQ